MTGVNADAAQAEAKPTIKRAGAGINPAAGNIKFYCTNASWSVEHCLLGAGRAGGLLK
jgi:hypothetical protein